MFAILLPMLLKWLPGGILSPILDYLGKRADSKNEALRIEVQREIELRQAQRDVLVAETEHWVAWLPRFAIAMSVALYLGAIFIDSTFDLAFVVLRVPTEMDTIISVVVGGLFLERTAKILKR